MTMRADDLYEADFYAWTKRQTKALRALRETRPNVEVDWERLIEEVHDLGKSERNALRSWTTKIIEHLLKLQFSPATDPRLGWMDETVLFRREVADNLTPSLRRDLAARLPRLYAAARDDLRRKLGYRGETKAAATLPEACPYTLQQVLDADWWPERRED